MYMCSRLNFNDMFRKYILPLPSEAGSDPEVQSIEGRAGQLEKAGGHILQGQHMVSQDPASSIMVLGQW